jgi:putative salt-induced outer membrane protein YdiY
MPTNRKAKRIESPIAQTLRLMAIVAASPLALFANSAAADKVVLDNGDVLSGIVVKLQGGKLTLKTDYAGSVDIESGKVKTIVTDQPVEVHTTGGEVLKGKLRVVEPGKLAVEPSPERQATAVDLQKVAAINPPPQGLWTGSVTVGGNVQSGNTDHKAASVAASAERRTDRDRIGLGFIYNYGKDNDQLTVRNTFANAKYDYFFTKHMYGYLGFELLNDKFQDVDLRATVGPGIGYQFWDDPAKALALEAGVSYVSDNLRVGTDNDYFASRFGFNFRYNFSKVVVFTNHLLYYPSLERFSTYRLRNEAALTSPLGAQWALKLANIYQYNNEPSPGLGKTDSQWILGLQYSY